MTRRMATMLFVDIVESTETLGRLGDARWASLLAQHHAIVADSLARHRGQAAGSSGDGFLALFEVPLRALRCAAELHQALGALGLRTRIGVHCGEIEDIGDGVAGINVHVAARIMAQAAADEVLVSSTLRELVTGAGLRFTDRGTHTLKGIPDEWRLYAVDPRSVRPVDPRVEVDASALPLPTAVATTESMPFLGRDAEIAQLSACWARAAAENPQCLLVAGEPGAGKTRLVSEFARMVHGAGGHVLWGRCDEGLSVPFQPLVEALDHVVTHAAPPRLRALLGDNAGELSRLVPRIRQLLPDVREPAPSDPETERYRLFEAGADVVRRAGSSAPTLLVVDDAHWATDPTLKFLRHLVQRATGAATMVVVTYRDTLPDLTDGLVSWLGDVSRLPGVERLQVNGLAPDAVAALVGAVLDARPEESQRLAAEVHQRTAGNALFTTQLLRHVGELESPGNPGGDRALPPEIRDVISSRLLRLPDQTRRVLAEAAVLGQQFTLDVLSAMTPELTAMDVLRALDGAAQAHLVTEEHGGKLRYRFTHALVVDSILDSSPGGWLRDAHLRAAAAWEATSVADPSWATAELARHHVAASLDPVKEHAYSRAAGDTAMTALAYGDAVRFYQQALDAADRSETSALERAELLLCLANAEAAAGMASYRTTLETLWRTAIPLGGQSLLVRAAMAIVRGNWSSSGTVDHGRVAVLEAALSSGPLPDATRARLTAQLAAELSWSYGERRRREALVDEALHLVSAIGDVDERMRVIGQCASSAQHPDNMHRIGALLDEHEPMLDEMTDPVVALQAAWTWLTYAGLRAEPARLQRHVARMEQLVGYQPVPLAVYLAQWIRLTILFQQGHFDAVLAGCDELLELGAALGQDEAGMIVAYYHLLIGHQRGDTADLLPLLEAYAEEYAEGLPGLRIAVAMFRACVGNLASARHILDEAARDEFTLLRQDQASALWLAWAADVAHRTRAVDHATTLYRILLPYDDQLAGNGGYLVGSMHHWLGVLAETTGDTAAADDHFAAAIEVHAALGMTYWSLASRAARAAARLGAATEAHHAGAREELLDVRAAAETGGYGRIVADIDAVLAGPPRQLTVGDTSAALQP